MGAASLSVVKARDPQFELAPRKEQIKFDKSQGENSYDYIPEELAQKHEVTIKKIDEIMVRDLPAEGITSTSERFSLNYYVHIIKIGVLPYVQDEQLAKEIEAFTDEAWEKYLFNKEEFLEQQNKIEESLRE